MTHLVPGSDIERIVGVARHRKAHYGRASSTEQIVYIGQIATPNGRTVNDER